MKTRTTKLFGFCFVIAVLCATIFALGVVASATGASCEHTGGTATCTEQAVCENCGTAYGDLNPENHVPTIVGANLTLNSDLTMNYYVSVCAEYESTISMHFNINDINETVTEHIIENGLCKFTFKDITLQSMGDDVNAELVDADGTVLASVSGYSVKTYCYNTLANCAEGGKYENNTELKALIVDLLNYGAAAQVYADYKVDALVNAELTAEQASWATPDESVPAYENNSNPTYVTVDAESEKATWKGAYLYLQDAIVMNFVFETAEDVSDIQIVITTVDPNAADAEGDTWVITRFNEKDTNRYAFGFGGFKAAQMRDVIYLTVCDAEGNAISDTLSYSVASYVNKKQSDSDTNLVALLNTMMKYGDSAAAYMED